MIQNKDLCSSTGVSFLGKTKANQTPLLYSVSEEMIPEKIVTIDNTAPTGIYVVHGGTNLMLISCLLQYLKCITSSLMSVIVKTT